VAGIEDDPVPPAGVTPDHPEPPSLGGRTRTGMVPRPGCCLRCLLSRRRAIEIATSSGVGGGGATVPTPRQTGHSGDRPRARGSRGMNPLPRQRLHVATSLLLSPQRIEASYRCHHDLLPICASWIGFNARIAAAIPASVAGEGTWIATSPLALQVRQTSLVGRPLR
jgi:hypothetical protein